jgi:hypothetical protein
MDREGIVVNKSKTKWGFSNVFCESYCEEECVWDVAQAEMVQYMLTQPEDSFWATQFANAINTGT